MASPAAPRPTIFGMVLADVRTANNMQHAALAHAMNANNVLAGHHTDAELERHLQSLETADLGFAWPLRCTPDEFIACLCLSLPTTVFVAKRLEWALILDDFARQGC